MRRLAGTIFALLALCWLSPADARVSVGLLVANPPPVVALNFTTQSYSENGANYTLGALPGWSFSRASTGYAQKSDGTLVSFASGRARITDLGLLIEQSATNLALQSQNLSAATWTQDNTTASTSGNAPDGTATAQVLNEGTATGAHFAYQTITVTSGQQAAVSEYVNTCTTTRRYVQVGMSSSTPAGGVWATFDTQGLTFTETTASGAGVYTTSTKTQLGSGCWWRISVTGSITGATTYYVAPELASTATPGGFGFTGQSYAGTNLLGVFWGFQAETAAFPTSYIPTTTATATRAKDVWSVSGFSLPNATEVASYGAISGVNVTLLQVNGVEVVRNDSNSAFWMEPNPNFATGNLTTSPFKVGLVLTPNGRMATANGAKPTSNTATNAATTSIGAGSTTNPNGYVQSVTLYPQAKNPAQLQALTH